MIFLSFTLFSLQESDVSDENSTAVEIQPQIMCRPALDKPSTSSCSNKIIIISNEVINLPDCTESNMYNRKSNDCAKTTNKSSRLKDYCFYCDTAVLNFARHLKRNHLMEFDVQKIFSYPANSKQRKDLITALRKKGNFVENGENGKPVKKPAVTEKLLPCPNCYGFYAAKSLWRHKKRCTSDLNSHSQSDAQSFIVRNLTIDKNLRENVFPRMRADDLSLVAKKDSLICEFGARYIKIHREQHFVNVASRKMRELSRLLIKMRNLNPAIKTLLDALKPENYDLLVKATKIVAQFDEENEFYKSPTYAMNMGTSLKQCCDIALLNVYKRKSVSEQISLAGYESDLKTLIHLIDSQWKFDVSSQAANDLNIAKWNKVTLLPLASDLKLLKEFLILKANEAELKLENNPDETAYSVLLETVFCRVILLNRRRPLELQNMLLRTYVDDDHNAQNYEEFNEVVTPTEKILIKTFKRVVVRGKRGRGVPVLFSNDVQKHMETLLKHRNSFVRKENLFLFGNPNTTQPICGYKILKKYSHKCGAKNAAAITCTKLRKHLATLSQIFNMSENDLEQLATFMGHTVGVHRQAYRLPDDIYQTAKISKLLLLMEKGEAGHFKGKTLDEIDIDMEENLIETSDEKEDEATDQSLFAEIEDSIDVCMKTKKRKEQINVQQNSSKEASKPKRTLIPWNEEQKKIVNEHFEQHIKNKLPPKKAECQELKKKFPKILHNKDWLKIKVYVQNKYTKKLK